jgi:putative drug exporter of the RND superfamily
MIERLRTLPAGRRAKWVVLVVWIAAAAGLGQYQAKLQDATKNDPATFLPASAESTRVLQTLRDRFTNGRTTPALVVWSRRGGLTPADRRAAAASVARIRGLRLAATLPPSRPAFTRETAVAAVPITADDIDLIKPVVERVRTLVAADRPPGLETYVTGPAGITVDAVDVFGQIDVTLLAATTALVLVLLLLIYRSPVIALVPLGVVALAYAIAAGIVYLLIEATGLVVNGQTTGILIILMFGAGTDYCLLIVSRYREELRKFADRHEAMAAALRHTSPAILSSGATVVVAMLVLLLADLRTFRSAGPVLALGVATTMLAGLTLLPAVLTVVGRRAFWPAVPRLASGPVEPSALWHRVGRRVGRRPLLVAVAVVAALSAAAVGNAVDLPGLSLGSGFRGSVESVRGLQALSRSLPAGEVAPTDVVVDTGAAAQTAAALRRVDGVASVRRVGTSDDGRLAHLQVTLRADPYADEAIDLVGGLREAAPAALVGGATAEEADTRTTTSRDERLIVPVTLLAILAILCALLRAVVAPVYLVASVVLSFAATMGLSYAAFGWLFDSPGSDASLPLFVFLFVVALGVDYNIFLMTRVREEVHRGDVRTGVLHGLERTGGVITSAGVVLAGTFAVLMLLPLEQLFQLGFAVALGVLVDTFVVRTLLVPAIALLAGRVSWWPSVARRSSRP